MSQGLALACLLLMGGWVLFGPSGLISWSENNRLLTERQKELQQLSAERDVLKNRVALLNPNHVDADMAGQLLRTDLNVVHPDEMVLLLD
ncbi:septum formation initiator family protein [Novosphingobium sp.]|uniref:FtsB family cell division protein n=1 Tax=Novosphingobium sp. TaxID=1874826 RepID=UPI0025DE55AE|nr:septum formation initiator family protein [Novosphingobium sp.]MCC6925569.1 septum formation initiator family protein [Novosphingobium sp.]